MTTILETSQTARMAGAKPKNLSPWAHQTSANSGWWHACSHTETQRYFSKKIINMSQLLCMRTPAHTHTHSPRCSPVIALGPPWEKLWNADGDSIFKTAFIFSFTLSKGAILRSGEPPTAFRRIRIKLVCKRKKKRKKRMIPAPSKNGFVSSPPSDSRLNQDLWRERHLLSCKASLGSTAVPGGQGSWEPLEATGLAPLAGPGCVGEVAQHMSQEGRAGGLLCWEWGGREVRGQAPGYCHLLYHQEFVLCPGVLAWSS